MWKGGRVGPGWCWPPRVSWMEGVSKKTMNYCLLCVDLHTISNAPFLVDMYHGLRLARAGGHVFFLSFFLGFRRPNLLVIAGLIGWQTPD